MTISSSSPHDQLKGLPEKWLQQSNLGDFMDYETNEMETARDLANQMIARHQKLTAETGNFARQPLRILIVEDDVSLKKVILRSLKMLVQNVEVEWATSADQFFLKQREYKRRGRKFFDLVLADIHMPGANSGFEVWNHFTMLDPSIPVVIMSGLGESEFERIVGGKASIHYVQKPLNLEKCAAVLDLCG